MPLAAHPPSPVSSESVGLASSLYTLLLSVEQALLRPDAHPIAPILGHARRLEAEVSAASDRSDDPPTTAILTRAKTHLDALNGALTLQTRTGAIHDSWMALIHDYEALRALIRRQRIPVPRGLRLGSVKPTNLGRNIFHVGMAVGPVLLYEFLIGRTGILILCGVILAGYTGLEVVRRRSESFNTKLFQTSFGTLSRPQEVHALPAGAWFILGLFIGTLLLPQHAIELGLLVLGFGDPAASLVGKRWGRTRLVGQKTLAGAVAFFVVSLVVVAGFVAVALPQVSLLSASLLITAPALAGVAAELFNGPLDDNLTISLAAGGIAAAILAI